MKALILKKGKLKFENVNTPVSSEDEALVKVLKAGICNTDLEMLKGYMGFEGIPGHEFAGRVVESPQKKWQKKRIVGEINIACSKYELCRQGKAKHCLSRSVLGINKKNGAFAEYLTFPLKNLHLLPQIISDEAGVFVEPLAASLEILDRVKLEKKDSVLVLGDGKLGLLEAQVFKLKTEQVYCLGKYERKLEIQKRRRIKINFKVQS